MRWMKLKETGRIDSDASSGDDENPRETEIVSERRLVGGGRVAVKAGFGLVCGARSRDFCRFKWLACPEVGCRGMYTVEAVEL